MLGAFYCRSNNDCRVPETSENWIISEIHKARKHMEIIDCGLMSSGASSWRRRRRRLSEWMCAFACAVFCINKRSKRAIVHPKRRDFLKKKKKVRRRRFDDQQTSNNYRRKKHNRAVAKCVSFGHRFSVVHRQRTKLEFDVERVGCVWMSVRNRQYR